jgi:hypothetical protein
MRQSFLFSVIKNRLVRRVQNVPLHSRTFLDTWDAFCLY